MTQPSTRRRPQGPKGSTRRSAGFTLIELMIAVAVIGILASIAYPSYTRYVERSRVTDGQAKVMEIASRLERCYTVTNDYRYRNTAGDPCVDFTDLQSDEEYYDISATGVDGTGSLGAAGYRVLANKSDKGRVACDELWVSSRGNRGGDSDDCW